VAVSPLSSDPEARDRQLANLVPGARTAPPGNRRALKHGAHATLSAEAIADEVRELYDVLADSAPLRDRVGNLPVADEAAVEVAARALHRYRKIATWLDLHGRLDEKTGEPKGAARYEVECERALERSLDALGLNPRSRAKLGLDLADAAGKAPDLARALAQGNGNGEGGPA
jgi:hypothetical protein